MADVFLSYSSEDRPAAQAIAQALSARGRSVWWDRSIRAGEDFFDVIERQLDAAKCVVVLWSSSSVASRWVRAEAAEALKQGKLIPVLVGDCRPPLVFREIQQVSTDAMGRLDEGLAHSREAAKLDPLSLGPAHNIAINAMIRGDYELAAAGFRHTIDIDPNWTWGYIKLARTLGLQKNCKEAFAQAEIAERRIAGGAAPLSWSWLGVTYATCGDVGRARDKLEQLHALANKQYVDPVTFAEIHGALGDVEEALSWYEKAFADRTPNMVYAAILPRLSPHLAGNQRFDAIIDRMRFPRSGR